MMATPHEEAAYALTRLRAYLNEHGNRIEHPGPELTADDVDEFRYAVMQDAETLDDALLVYRDALAELEKGGK
jgi:hypothetical protein